MTMTIFLRSVEFAFVAFGRINSAKVIRTIPGKFLIVFLFILPTVAASCKIYDSDANLRGDRNDTNQAAVNASNNQANVARDDVIELSKIINLPFEPEQEAVFREDGAGSENNTGNAPGRKKLVAVMKFSESDAEKIVEQSAKYQPAPAPVKLEAESWFPPELIAVTQESGDESLKGTAYPANDFFNPPYASGRITRVNRTDYFVLELFESK